MVSGINGSPHRPVITSCYHARDEREGRPWIRRCLVTQLNLRSTRTRSDVAGSMGADINCGAPVWVISDWWWSIKVDDRNSYISRKEPCIIGRDEEDASRLYLFGLFKTRENNSTFHLKNTSFTKIKKIVHRWYI